MKFLRALFYVGCCLFGWCSLAIAEPPIRPLTFKEYRHAVDQIDYEKHTINLARFKELYGKPGVYILDLRTPEEYKMGHIKGALYLGADITDQRLRQLVPDKKATIITYCQSTFVPLSRRIPLTDVSLPQITALKYPNTYILKDSQWWTHPMRANVEYKAVFGPLWETGELPSDNPVSKVRK